jgi:NADPH2:quinone reductase
VAVIDPQHEDVKQRARELSAGGVDVVVDPVGGDLAETALRALGFGGRYLVIGFASGSIPSIPLNLVLLSSRSVIGVELGAEAAKNPALARAIYLEVIDGVASGRFRPVAPILTSMEGVVEAYRALRDREVSGKIAVVVSPARR